jgi:hypothetical protein
MLSISVSQEAFGKTPSQHTNRGQLQGAILGLRRLKRLSVGLFFMQPMGVVE